jgi:hypothetical protein
MNTKTPSSTGSERSLALGKLGEDPVRSSCGREFLAAAKHAEDP